jgi:CRP-like cAMP-binding protein
MKISELMSQNIALSAEECEAVDQYIPIKTFKKGTLLLKADQIANDSYFTIKGCVRLYYVVDGEDKTTHFFTEGDAIASMNSYINRVPANHYLECVEDCTLAVLNYEKEKILYKLFPRLESICRVSMEDDLGKHQEMLASHITKSPEQRYLRLLNERADLLQRVPQYHLASYLGVKPESLSRIRKRIQSRD